MPDQAMTSTQTPSVRVCALCRQPDHRLEILNATVCPDCDIKAHRAEAYRSIHCKVPGRYQDATCDLALPVHGRGYLFRGSSGTGKTHSAYGLVNRIVDEDRRLTVAAYSWPFVLWKLRKSYAGEEDSEESQEMVEALREADIAILDDLGVEKITAQNLDWIRETLFVILDHRYSWAKPTILTTNLESDQLPEYLGRPIASRVIEMCELVEMDGPNRRLTNEQTQERDEEGQAGDHAAGL